MKIDAESLVGIIESSGNQESDNRGFTVIYLERLFAGKNWIPVLQATVERLSIGTEKFCLEYGSQT